MKLFNDLLALTVEIAMLVGLGRAGFEYAEAAGYPSWTGMILPVLVIIIWGLWAAPKAKRRLKIPWLTVLKMFLISCTALLLWLTGYTPSLSFSLLHPPCNSLWKCICTGSVVKKERFAYLKVGRDNRKLRAISRELRVAQQ